MNKVVTILLFVALCTGGTRSVANLATLQNLHSGHPNGNSGVTNGSRRCAAIVHIETPANSTSGPGPAEEESEDEDSSGKEDIYHKMTSSHLTLFLKQQYGRQNAIFKENHSEVESPPPRF